MNNINYGRTIKRLLAYFKLFKYSLESVCRSVIWRRSWA